MRFWAFPVHVPYAGRRWRGIRRPLRQPVPKQGHALEHLDAAYAPYFYEPPVRDAVLRLKFENRTDLARPLALLQAEALKAAGCLGDVDALVPVPSGRGERRSRGYDVPLMLARALGRELGLPVMQALCKIRETPRQMALSGGERRKNLKNAFSAGRMRRWRESGFCWWMMCSPPAPR